ncbi:MAG: Taurine catabolism dioxygenase TauD/TfdA [Bacteroidetes bacterium]|jgi:alpha-ketoglutarate-dependent taurine dioxygenase|nr:Taurine catabolism dioxygenase TauD/TfdA [Bacteroidota bacterium]
MNKPNFKKDRFSEFLNSSAETGLKKVEGADIDLPGGNRNYPLIFRCTDTGLNFGDWVRTNKTVIDEHLEKTGAVLFRDFNIEGIEGFRSVTGYLSDSIIGYSNRSSPRTEISDKIYTSTDHPKDQHINMHNELSYAAEWPAKIMFFCDQPSETGGETPIADNREVIKYISAETQKKFLEKGILYKRNLGNGIGLHWNEVFQTTDKNTVEENCIRNNISFEWKENEILSITWKKPAFQVHPSTKEKIWFNHAYFFNEQTLDDFVLNTLKKDEIPFNTFYGDGSPIEKEVITEIGTAYSNAVRTFKWKKNDLLLLDNIVMTHGRYAYSGKRVIAVAMAGLMSS